MVCSTGELTKHGDVTHDGPIQLGDVCDAHELRLPELVGNGLKNKESSLKSEIK